VWIATIRSPSGEPLEYLLKPGSHSIGRSTENDIVLETPSASRRHAEIVFDLKAGNPVLHDLNSTNGTFVNRERISSPVTLKANDMIRIGDHLIVLLFKDTNVTPAKLKTNTQFLTRDFILESLDRQAVLLYEVSSRLNTVIDLDTALNEVASLMKTAMGVDRCEVIMAEQFDQLAKHSLAESIATEVIDNRMAVIVNDAQTNPKYRKTAALRNIHMALCVPVISADRVLAVVYAHKTRQQAKPFDQGDLQLAAAISHQAALTIERMHLLKRVSQEQAISHLLKRFLSPKEADYLLQDYLKSGQLPPLEERTLTVLAIDIRDSSGLAERLGACRFGEILSRYYHEMTDAVFKYNGMVNRYLGDGLQAVFGMTHHPSTPEENAARTALEMLNRLRRITKDAGEALEVGIGINTGSVAAGYLGSDEHVEFTVVGDTVNVAWGLESHARPNRIFISERTCEALVGKFRIVPLKPIEMKKRSRPCRAFEILTERKV
jgi:adenylate cyclase